MGNITGQSNCDYSPQTRDQYLIYTDKASTAFSAASCKQACTQVHFQTNCHKWSRKKKSVLFAASLSEAALLITLRILFISKHIQVWDVGIQFGIKTKLPNEQNHWKKLFYVMKSFNPFDIYMMFVFSLIINLNILKHMLTLYSLPCFRVGVI